MMMSQRATIELEVQEEFSINFRMTKTKVFHILYMCIKLHAENL